MPIAQGVQFFGGPRRPGMNPVELQRTHQRSRLLSGLLVVTITSVMTIADGVIVRTQAPANPIVVENQQPGTGAWWWTKLADDTNQQIKGYASATSVNQ